ncbi:c-type cytochrome biogenesis protein CcmI [Roseibium aestuarii]|uniref:C-type cytochrome biogenesis protein CcmI n=1 Tax=Roseibium aestuarii TaxID=2600299 RepID=A0ABW4JTG7_9HYPH|nr:c-type cytochrome biogenesis protein CcmI [Roseibium aestuarii]
MMFWISIAALTAAAALSVLMPLARTRQSLALSSDGGPAGAATGVPLDADVEVYRAQLDELERDLERGLINKADHASARTEIARRLLAAEEERTRRLQTPERSVGRSRRLATLAVIALVPLLSLGLYLTLGSPDLPDQPLLARLEAPVENQSVDQLVARVERHLSQNPQDGKGWDVVAPVYMRIGRPEDAARAYGNSIRLLGETEGRLTSQGEALTVANNGIISAAAQQAFEAAVRLDPQAIKPRFFLALALTQDGSRDAAVAAWTRLLDGADETAAWVPVARQHLADLTGTAPAPALPGPDAAQVDAASRMTTGDRTAMIEGMVAGLDERLRSEGGSAEEWQRLIRAQAVLGRADAAREAADLARTALVDNQEALAQINALVAELGL